MAVWREHEAGKKQSDQFLVSGLLTVSFDAPWKITGTILFNDRFHCFTEIGYNIITIAIGHSLGGNGSSWNAIQQGLKCKIISIIGSGDISLEIIDETS
jgi:hypothetical protein